MVDQNAIQERVKNIKIHVNFVNTVMLEWELMIGVVEKMNLNVKMVNNIYVENHQFVDILE